VSIVTLVPSATAVPFGNFVCAAMSGGISIDFDKTFIVQMVVFAALIPVLKWALFEPILKVFEERERRTDGARAEARRMQEEAGELLRKYEKELQKIHQVAADERDRLRAETTKLEAEILEDARQVVNRIVTDGRGKIESQVNAIRFDLGRQSEELAGQMAERVLGREVRR
jgi:F-type H+-transporting ATPase subunit b